MTTKPADEVLSEIARDGARAALERLDSVSRRLRALVEGLSATEATGVQAELLTPNQRLDSLVGYLELAHPECKVQAPTETVS